MVNIKNNFYGSGFVHGLSLEKILVASLIEILYMKHISIHKNITNRYNMSPALTVFSVLYENENCLNKHTFIVQKIKYFHIKIILKY